MVFAIINFFAFRYFRAYTYYELVVIVYEALVLMAFLALMLAYVGESSDRQKEVLRMKEKRGLPWPLGFVKFRCVRAGSVGQLIVLTVSSQQTKQAVLSARTERQRAPVRLLSTPHHGHRDRLRGLPRTLRAPDGSLVRQGLSRCFRLCQHLHGPLRPYRPLCAGGGPAEG